MSHEARVKELQLELPPPGKSIGCYKLVNVIDGLAYVSGTGPAAADATATCGKRGDTLKKEAGYAAARRTGLRMLATLRAEFGTLDAIGRLVKTIGFVN